MKITTDTLGNGLRIVFAERHTAPVISYQAWVGVGSADERQHEAGLSHVLEHMLFKGTPKRKTGQIVQDVENAGGVINAWTAHDETVFHITLAAKYKDQGLAIIADAIQNAAIDADELERELTVVREEILMGKDSPGRVVIEELFGSAFAGHPYGRPVIGYDKTVARFDRPLVHDFYKRWYIPNNIVLVVSGDFDSDKMLPAIERQFGGFAQQRLPRRIKTRLPADLNHTFISHQVQPFTEAGFAVGFDTPALEDPDTPALDLLAALLGQGSSSRLDRQLNRKLGLVNSIHAMSHTPIKRGIFSVLATTRAEHIIDAIAKSAEAVYDLAGQNPSGAEIEKARTLLEADEIYAEETVDGVGRKLGFYALHVGDVHYDAVYRRQLAEVDGARISEVAAKYLTPGRAHVTCVMPDPTIFPPEKRTRWLSASGLNSDVFQAQLRRELKKAEPKKPASKATAKKTAHPTVLEMSSGDVLIVQSEPGSKYAAARVAFLGGNILETKPTLGVANLWSNTLVRGTENQSAEEVSLRMDDLACAVSGFAGRSAHGVQGEFLARNFVAGFELMADCLRRPAFPAEEVKRELVLQRAELEASLDDPASRSFQLMRSELYGRHPYGRMVLGTETSIGNIQREDLLSYHRKATVHNKMVLTVVGGLGTDEVRDLAERTIFADRAKQRAPKDSSPPSFRSNGPRQKGFDLQREQFHVALGFPGTTVHADDKYALEVAVEILGGHGGRLFAAVRDRHSLAYNVGAGSWESLQPGLVAIYAATAAGNERQLVDIVLKELEQLRSKGPTKKEFERVKRFMIGTRAIASQRASARAAAMALGELAGIGCEVFERDAQGISRVTPADVIAAAKRFLDLDRMVAIGVGPDARKAALL